MSRSKKRILSYLMLLAGGAVFAVDGANAGLASCASTAALNSVNFCFVFDCANGALGGTIEFCGINGGTGDIFADCPNP